MHGAGKNATIAKKSGKNDLRFSRLLCKMSISSRQFPHPVHPGGKAA